MDPLILRRIAEQVRVVVAANPNAVDAHLDWGERVPLVQLRIDPERLRLIGLTPRELAAHLEYQLRGLPATETREDIRNVQLILRGLPAAAPVLGPAPDQHPAALPGALPGAGSGPVAAAETPDGALSTLTDITLKTLDGRSIPLE